MRFALSFVFGADAFFLGYTVGRLWGLLLQYKPRSDHKNISLFDYIESMEPKNWKGELERLKRVTSWVFSTNW